MKREPFSVTPRTITDHIRAHLYRDRRGLDEGSGGWWDESFIEGMAARLYLGARRYGPLNVGRFKSVSSAIRRLEMYLPDRWISFETQEPPDGSLVWLFDGTSVAMTPVRWYQCNTRILYPEATHWRIVETPAPPRGDPGGNIEHLIDAANLCKVESMRARFGLSEHPSPRWAPKDDGEHTERIA